MLDFRSFYDQNLDKVFNYCLYRTHSREAAEDVVSEAFHRLLEHGWENIENPKAYLYQICRNLIIDNGKLANSHVSFEWMEENGLEPGYEFDGIKMAQTRQILDEIEQLPDDQREVLLMQYVQDLPNDAICKILDKTESSVKSLAHRGLETIREKINK